MFRQAAVAFRGFDLSAGAFVHQDPGVALIVGSGRTGTRCAFAGGAIVGTGQRHPEALLLRLGIIGLRRSSKGTEGQREGGGESGVMTLHC